MRQLYHKIFRNILSQNFRNILSQNFRNILSQNFHNKLSQQTFTLCIAIIFDEQLSHLNTFLFVNLSITHLKIECISYEMIDK